MKKSQIKAAVAAIARATLPSNAKTYSYRTWDAQLSVNQLGGIRYLTPSSGTVVSQADGLTIVKTGRTTFDAVSTELLDKPLSVGDRVDLSYYQLRNFDGKRADGSEYGAGVFALTGAKTYLPCRWPDRYYGVLRDATVAQFTPIQNACLRELILQLEDMPVDGGMRKVANVLVDANATALTFTDPPFLGAMNPAMSMHIASGKFIGQLTIYYNAGADTYGIRLEPQGIPEATRLTDIYFDDMGKALLEHIDDGSWKNVKVNVTKKASVPRKKPLAA